MNIAFVFPGQGSQKVGMCAAFTNGFQSGRETMEEIEEAVSFNISKIINEGSEEQLTATQNAQIALFAVSMAVLNVLRDEFGFNITQNIQYMAGHSLGEYTALCASSVLSLRDAAKLIRKRGELMAGSARGEQFRMEAVIGLAADELEELVKPYQSGRNICVIANDNSDSQVILSGSLEAVSKVSAQALEIGAKKTIKLNTGGPFHSPLMANAAIELDSVLSEYSQAFMEMKIPVIMNITAKPLQDKEQLHSLLVQQMTGRVRWRESVKFMIDAGVDCIVEIGSGKVLTKLSKRAYPGIDMVGIETIAEMENFINSVS